MKTLQDRCVASEGVIRRFCKCQEIENKKQAQYLEAVCTLNQELTAKTKALAEETQRLEEVEKAKTNLATELTAFHEQMEKARADAMVEFRISQPFFNACGVYYGDEFKDCLKQVKFAYPNLDLSQIVINDIISPTPRGDDTVNDETIDFAHTVKKVVKQAEDVGIAQLAPNGPDIVVVLSAKNPATTDGLPAVNLPFLMPIHLDFSFFCI